MFELVISTLQLCLVVIVVFQVILYQKIRKAMAAGGGGNDDDVYRDLTSKRSTPYYRERNSTLLKNVLYQCEELLETTKNGTSNALLSNYDNQYRTINNNEFRSIQTMLDKIRPIVKPIMKLSCRNCTPTSKKDFATKNSIVVVNNILKPNRMFTSSHSSNGGDDDDGRKWTFFGRFSFLRQISQVVKYQYTHVGEEILQNERIREAIDETALQYFYDGTNTQNFSNENHQRLLAETEKRAKSILTAMKSRISDFLLRFISWILYKLLPCFLNDVRVRPEQIEMLRKASETKNPLIFLPVHKSHLDYILVSFILFNNNIRAPLVAAGDNLRIPFFGSLLRGLGAFFIKRRINPIMGNKDHVYKAVLQEYMNECLKSGHNIEFFLEGGRTRSGKTCMPKYGLLSVIVDALTNGVIDDAFLVPIGINYERLVDGNFVRELLGEPKQMETFTAALKGIWSVLNSNYGSVCVDFCQPFSLRELIRTFERGLNENPNRTTGGGAARKLFRNNLSISSIYGTDLVHQECKQIVENISRHILWDCTNTTAIMGTNAIAFVLLVKHRDAHKRNGIEMSELLGDLQRIAFDLKWDERYFAFEYSEDYARMVTKTHKILGPKLIEVVGAAAAAAAADTQRVFARPELESVIELSYYANILNNFYALQSVIANVILNSANDDLNENEILDNCMELCDILQFEFIFCKPCQDLSTILSLTLENMIVTDEILYVQPPKEDENINGNGTPLATSTATTTTSITDITPEQNGNGVGRVNDEIADDDGIEMLTKRYYRKDIAFDRNKRLRFLKSVLEPLICTYTEVTAKLIELTTKPCSEQEFIRGLLADLKIKWHEGSLKYAESISVDTIKNALKLLQKWSIIDLQSRDDVMQIIAIENAAKIDQLLVKFGKFR